MVARRIRAMPRIYNRQEYNQIRKLLRQNLTKVEIILWSRLQRRRLGYKFRRQYGIGPYVVDFFCKELRLAIEVDGPEHLEDSWRYRDYERQKYIESLYIKVVRFSNDEVLQDTDWVIEQLRGVIRKIDHPPFPS